MSELKIIERAEREAREYMNSFKVAEPWDAESRKLLESMFTAGFLKAWLMKDELDGYLQTNRADRRAKIRDSGKTQNF